MPNFYIHVKSHESVPSNCSICDKTFQSTIALNKHKKNVHSGKNIHCETFDKQFTTNSNLNKHMKLHTVTITPEIKDKGNFKCPKCGKGI